MLNDGAAKVAAKAAAKRQREGKALLRLALRDEAKKAARRRKESSAMLWALERASLKKSRKASPKDR